jgi:hypothetical protein
VGHGGYTRCHTPSRRHANTPLPSGHPVYTPLFNHSLLYLELECWMLGRCWAHMLASSEQDGLCVLLVRCLVLLVTADRSLGPLGRWSAGPLSCVAGPLSCVAGPLVLWSAVLSSASCSLPCHQLRACVYQTRDRETRGRGTRGRETRDERRETRDEM